MELRSGFSGFGYLNRGDRASVGLFESGPEARDAAASWDEVMGEHVRAERAAAAAAQRASLDEFQERMRRARASAEP